MNCVNDTSQTEASPFFERIFMKEVILDALLDSLKNLPFLFGAYLLLEFLEHRASQRLTAALSKPGPWGPLGGALLGCVPQCGFSVAAANFYAGRLISPGTLLAVFLATSDEAIPILFSRPGALPILLRLLGGKLAAAAFFGLLTDFIFKRFLRPSSGQPFQDLCQECGCEEKGLARSALRHTVQVFLFLLLTNLVLGSAIFWVGDEAISRVLLSGSLFQPLLAALLGFVPNCAASVILTELYLTGSLSFGSAVAGLCTGAGLGLAVLFRVNKNWRENLWLLLALYACAVLTGFFCALLPV